MVPRIAGWLLLAVLLGYTSTFANPLVYHETERQPLAVTSELSQRLASHTRLQESGNPRLGLGSRLEPGDFRLGLTSRPDSGDSRLGLPSPQEIDAIKKVAQILVMLGEQVIPTIIGNIAPPPHAAISDVAVPVEDVSNDPVSEN